MPWRRGKASGRGDGGLDDARLQVEELVQVGEEQAVLVETRQAAENGAQVGLAALEGLVVHDQVAERDEAVNGLPGDVRRASPKVASVPTDWVSSSLSERRRARRRRSLAQDGAQVVEAAA